MNHLLLVPALFIILTAPSPLAAAAQAAADKSLSPYFFVESRDDSVDHFPLKSTEVDVVINGIIADVTVRQRYANSGGRAINGRYVFPASTRAAVHGMTMTIGEQVIRARIKEKDEADRIFQKAKRDGKSASLLEQKRPNVFSMQVANIMPGDVVDIELRYTELLILEDGMYEFVYPTVVGPRYSSGTGSAAGYEQRWVKNPYLERGKDARTVFSLRALVHGVLPISEIRCPSHETNIAFQDETTAALTLDEGAGFGGDRDFTVRYRLVGKEIASGLLLHRAPEENHFLLLAQPPKRISSEHMPPRDYCFVVDVSGSMSGFPLETAKTLLADLLGSLRPDDTFNVVLFAGGSEVFAPAPVAAAPDEIARAVRFIDSSSGGGGTELLRAMQRAYNLSRRDSVSRTMVVVTDGYISAERDVFKVVQAHLNQANTFVFGIGSSVNRYLVEGMAKSGQGEPFTVTDPGEAQAVAQRFRRYISQPVLTDVELAWDGVEVYDLEPPCLPDLFAQRPVAVSGKWRGEGEGILTLSGRGGQGEYRQQFRLGEGDSLASTGALRYLWARARIARLSDYRSNRVHAANREEIVALGLSHNLLTAFTSFVAVAETIVNPDTPATDVTQPLPLPKGVPNAAIGGSLHQVDEPRLSVLAMLVLMLALFGAAGRCRGKHVSNPVRRGARP